MSNALQAIIDRHTVYNYVHMYLYVCMCMEVVNCSCFRLQFGANKWVNVWRIWSEFPVEPAFPIVIPGSDAVRQSAACLPLHLSIVLPWQRRRRDAFSICIRLWSEDVSHGTFRSDRSDWLLSVASSAAKQSSRRIHVKDQRMAVSIWSVTIRHFLSYLCLCAFQLREVSDHLLKTSISYLHFYHCDNVYKWKLRLSDDIDHALAV